MSSKFRNILSNRDSERERATTKTPKTRDRDKDKEKDKAKEKEKEKENQRRLHRGKKGGSSTTDRDSGITARSTSSSSNSRTRTRRSSMPEVESTVRSSASSSFLDSRTSLPYPTFSKAHSKEALYGQEDNRPKADILTPNATDLVEEEHRKTQRRRLPPRNGAPPSPPLTADRRSSRKESAGSSRRPKDQEKDGKSKGTKINFDPVRSTSSLGRTKDESSRSSTKSPRPDTPVKTRLRDSSTPLRSTSHKTSSPRVQDLFDLPRRAMSHNSKSPAQSSITTAAESASESTNDSDATSIAPHQTQPPSRNPRHSSTTRDAGPRHESPIEVFVETENDSVINDGEYRGTPPPPPPPPQMPVSTPRVDYLLQNGGLAYQVPKNLLGAGQSQNMPQQLVQPQSAIVQVFEPYHRLLDDYSHIVSKNGSLAVATGYRSVARRLLDRLEAVFSRDISSETCQCLMCERDGSSELSPGVSWGEVLELVSGRRELPSWPPFQITTSIREQMMSSEAHIPMQELDIDVPEEYREHYVRQSRKTKQTVDRWLLGQTEQSPPDEVDDETLTFAMMTHIEGEQRELFRSLLGITSSTPVPRTSTPAPRSRPHFLVASSLAIQRLYRLAEPARDPETAIYMLNNPNIHNVLATLAAISNDEWEILISGRFDGFLRSGAEDNFHPSMTASAPPRAGSRSSTPFVNGSSRGPTPFQADSGPRPVSQPFGKNAPSASSGAPIVMDEDTEIAALAEVERDIYLSMEALEDAFEALHCKAEIVRRALRERGAGLSVANQARRGSAANLDARLGTPASVNGSLWESGLDEDDGIDDDMSLAPDDSASNVSSNRRRRPKRRTERRTPAPVEEEEEEDDAYARRDRRR